MLTKAKRCAENRRRYAPAARLNRSIERFGLFALRPRLPAAVHPEILTGIGADHVFDPLGVSLRDVAQRIVLRLPILGPDDVLGADLEFELIVHAAREADDDGHVVLHGEQSDRLVRAGLSPEEIDEQAFAAGVLIRDET